ncbi:MAG: Flp pilus assembly complex ATPase component TadA [Candidatus Riflebacteria bacterium]|nr:Flp pilus assembly complex ATPase component TadA [Candidatus Riflebacteria bacterium]
MLTLGRADEVGVILGCAVQPVLSSPEGLGAALDRAGQSLTSSAQSVLDRLAGEDKPGGPEAETDVAVDLANEAPVIKVVNLLLLQAINDGASDIHLEPYETDLVVRYRIDGILIEGPKPPPQYRLAIIARLKIMASLDISETRLPQDGRIKIRMLEREYDIRISTLPGLHGESVVMRILDQSKILYNLEDIGFSASMLRSLLSLLAMENGIILVTGPTGSGKTTTLYAALNRLNQPDVKIITVEDPVEYRLRGVVQIQTNAPIGLTFAAALRSILRQDPDIVMIGEIRDLETASIGVQAALTGHLVFSTLHTNDAPSAVTRLIRAARVRRASPEDDPPGGLVHGAEGAGAPGRRRRRAALRPLRRGTGSRSRSATPHDALPGRPGQGPERPDDAPGADAYGPGRRVNASAAIRERMI